jgi:hypothetical protein
MAPHPWRQPSYLLSVPQHVTSNTFVHRNVFSWYYAKMRLLPPAPNGHFVGRKQNWSQSGARVKGRFVCLKNVKFWPQALCCKKRSLGIVLFITDSTEIPFTTHFNLEPITNEQSCPSLDSLCRTVPPLLNSLICPCGVSNFYRRFLWHQNVHYHGHKSRPVLLDVSNMNAVHALISYYLKNNFNIILAYTLKSRKRSLPFKSQDQNLCSTFSYIVCMLHASSI